MANNPNISQTSEDEFQEQALTFIRRFDTNKDRWNRLFDALQELERARMKRMIEKALKNGEDTKKVFFKNYRPIIEAKDLRKG